MGNSSGSTLFATEFSVSYNLDETFCETLKHYLHFVVSFLFGISRANPNALRKAKIESQN